MSDSGVGMPQHLLLDAWARLVMDALGPEAQPYLVGSALRTKTWRDVDVRVMLHQPEWERLLPGVPYSRYAGSSHPRWAALCLAFATWGQQFTGLPIDFQIQPWDDANERFPGNREPLGVRIPEPDDPPADPAAEATPTHVPAGTATNQHGAKENQR